MRHFVDRYRFVAAVSLVPLALAGCDKLTPNGANPTMTLLHDGSEKVCIAPDVQKALRDLIVTKPGDMKVGDIPLDTRVKAAAAVGLSYELTTLQSFDKGVSKATCNTTLKLRSANGGKTNTFRVDYAVSPSAENPATFVVTADVDDAHAFADDLMLDEIADVAAKKEIAEQAARAASLPAITASWLVGTWSSTDVRRDPNACDIDGLVHFANDGSYRDGEGRGRFRTDGHTLTYYARVMVDEAAETEDRSLFDQPLVTKVAALTDRSFSEDGETLYRCEGK